MSFHVARRFIMIPGGALFGCALLFLLSGLLTTPALACCGNGMGFPFFCLLILLTILTIFSIVSFLPTFARKSGDHFFGSAVFGRQLQPPATIIESTYLCGRFYLSLFLSSTLILVGAVLLFSFSFGFTWSALILGCLSIFLGIGILLLGLSRTRSPSQEE
ncbi:hypothetical protein ccbrp13_33910 [Ktedonobacteria bacterium brp13]|nr:hypothetical protein ccbrp13_33910 [Ktedonobacteria bacterium brp13]